jgi:23S rRNA (adenine2503-C2)-methyltransferase
MQHPKDLTLPELRAFAEVQGEKPYRGEQLFQSICKAGVRTRDDVKGIPSSFREKLPESMYALEMKERQTSKKDGTVKYLNLTVDGDVIESVLMKYRYGNTICISSQAGCRMGCSFCASGLLGLERNLSPGEMVDQLLLAREDSGEEIRHIVVMGTGEPMENLDNLSRFIEIVTDAKGLGLSKRNITVSSCGIIPKLSEFFRRFPQVGLAISLHGADDATRNNLMPIGRKYGVEAIVGFSKEYVAFTGRRITFEYALIKDVNDSLAAAGKLSRVLRGLNCHVNLIPLNPVFETKLAASSPESVQAFRKALEDANIQVTLRRAMGQDIAGACGQLRLKQKR